MIQIAIPGRQGGRTTGTAREGAGVRHGVGGRLDGDTGRSMTTSTMRSTSDPRHLQPRPPLRACVPDRCRREQSPHGCRDRGPRPHSDLSPVTRRALGYRRRTHHERRLPAAPDVGGLCERGGRGSARRKKTSARARASPSWPSRRVASSSGFRLRHVGGRAGGTWRVSPRRDPSARAITNPSCPGAWRRRSGAHRRPRRRPAPRGRSG